MTKIHYSSFCHQMFIYSSPFFFNATATSEIYTLSLHDALPISSAVTESKWEVRTLADALNIREEQPPWIIEDILLEQSATLVSAQPKAMKSLSLLYACLERDRKSTRLNSSHGYISYAVFCLKKK